MKKEKNTDYLKYTGLGTQIAATMLVWIYFGLWLDEKFETEPVFLLLAVFLGTFSAVYFTYKAVFGNNEKKK
ncbi:AtpZ/AtpI family protein [bacterium]|nr:AtpZ/AtpI family protein [bacterium]